MPDVNYYSWGVNGALTKLAGSHSFKIGADYRILGVDALSHGQSAGTYTFNGRFTGSNASSPQPTSRNAIADLLLGYPFVGHADAGQPLRQLRQLLRRLRAGRLARHRTGSRSTTACASSTRPDWRKRTISSSSASIATR